MKTIALLFALALCGCETTTNEDGTSTSRFDAAAFNQSVHTIGDTYDRYYRQQQQPYYIAP